MTALMVLISVVAPYIIHPAVSINAYLINAGYAFALAVELEFAVFSDGLTTNPVDPQGKVLPSALLRYIGINLRKTDKNKVEFLLKGELK